MRLWLEIRVFCLCAVCALPAFSAVAAQRQPIPRISAPVPVLKSPVEQFRELLAMSHADRARAITNRPPTIQQQLLAKLKEYDALSANERELRLRTTELRYYLIPMLNMPPADRSKAMDRIPIDIRQLVQDRLVSWDSLPNDLRRDLLENESIIRYFRESQARSAADRANEFSRISPGQRAQLESGIARWRAIPDDQQQKVMQRFDQLFVMSSRERDAVLKTLSEPERQQIEATLRSLEGLPPPQRIRCVQSLSKFVSLTAEERAEFLRSAERWRALSPDQRDAWRKMVARLSSLPPMPPGVTPWLPPPLPPVQTRPIANGN